MVRRAAQKLAQEHAVSASEKRHNNSPECTASLLRPAVSTGEKWLGSSPNSTVNRAVSAIEKWLGSSLESRETQRRCRRREADQKLSQEHGPCGTGDALLTPQLSASSRMRRRLSAPLITIASPPRRPPQPGNLQASPQAPPFSSSSGHLCISVAPSFLLTRRPCFYFRRR